MYDYLIVGAGFFGSICAYELNKRGKKVVVIDKRNHIGGNCYTEKRDDIDVHIYGPHIFHTSNEKVWKWINQFTEFNDFTLRPVALYKGKTYSLPFSMWTFSQVYGVAHPDQVKRIIEEQSFYIDDPGNLEEQAIKMVGKDVYDMLIAGYTEKQWMRPPHTLPKEIIQRLPVRFTYDNNYFNDKYQGIPIDGYTVIFEKLLKDIVVLLNVDFFEQKLPEYKKVIYTGAIDKFFNYQFGQLEYKTTRFDHRFLKSLDNYQGTAIMNFTDKILPQTRVIEHKHFNYKPTGSTWITTEYPEIYVADKNEPYYPVNDWENNHKYNQYKRKAANLTDVYFGGRLAEYKYYDMDDIIERALDFVKKDYL